MSNRKSTSPNNLDKPKSSEFNNLYLQNSKGNEITLTANQLVSFVRQQTDLDEKSKTGALQSSSTLGRFGLKNAEDVIRFLNSPAGQSTKAEIGAELALIAAIKEERRFQLMENQRLQRRVMAFVFLSLLAYREAKARNVNEQVAKQLSKILPKKSTGTSTLSPGQTAYQQAQHDILDAYDAEINFLGAEQDSYQKEEDKLKAVMEKHHEQSADLAAKYDIYDKALDDFERLEKDNGQSVDALEEQLSSLQNDMNEKTDEISQLLEAGDEKQARIALHELNGLQFKAAFVNDMISLAKKEKICCNAQGETIDSSSKAHFLIPANKKVVKHDDQYFLINAGQDIHSMSPEEKMDAAKHYKQSQAEILPIKNLVKNNQENEETHHHAKGEVITELLKQIDAQKKMLGNQLNQIQAARAAVAMNMDNPESFMQNQPVPVAIANASANRPIQPSISPAQSFKNIISFFKRMNDFEPKMTHQHFMELTKNNPKAQKALSSEFDNTSMSSPMTPAKIIHLLRVLERFGIDATKPGVTSILNPLELKAQAAENTATPLPTKPQR